jgi:hypothetical protein
MGGCSRNIIGQCGLNSSGSGQGAVVGSFEAVMNRLVPDKYREFHAKLRSC